MANKEARLQKKRDQSAKRWSEFKSNATAEDIERRREYERNKKKQQRAKETPEQREARLRKHREQEAAKRERRSTEQVAKENEAEQPSAILDNLRALIGAE